jgi:RNA polymerase sigma-70 factor (ECF subfamily)
VSRKADHQKISEDRDRQRIASAFAEHKRKIAAYLARSMIRPEDIEDILQEAVTKTLEISQRETIKSPKSYLFITARNLLRNQLKKQSEHVMTEITKVESSIDNGQAPAFQQVHDKRKFAAFISACETLPPQCKRVFLLRKVHGKSHKQIAKELNISTRTVERHITNAIKLCRDTMETSGYEVGYIRPVQAQTSSKGSR